MLSYHGKTLEQAIWVLKEFANEEVREFYKDNIGFNNWLDECRRIVEAERLNY